MSLTMDSNVFPCFERFVATGALQVQMAPRNIHACPLRQCGVLPKFPVRHRVFESGGWLKGGFRKLSVRLPPWDSDSVSIVLRLQY